jgi:hypothetical protein
MATAEPSEDWLIHPPQDIPDMHQMTIEEWRVAVERWCRQFEDQPQPAPSSSQEIASVPVSLPQATESHAQRLATEA